MGSISIATMAHVDAGKTTLSEAMLYEAGVLKKKGRVDHGDTMLDTDELEIKRGITIYARHARFGVDDMDFFLTDTPGHVDFAPETERALSVSDLAILVVAAQAGISGHIKNLYRILEASHVPAVVFVNKMDLVKYREQADAARDIIKCLSDGLKGNFVDFSSFISGEKEDEKFYEDVSVCDESLMENYLERGGIGEREIFRTCADRKLIPVLFGSALRGEGISSLLRLLSLCGREIWEEKYKGKEREDSAVRVFKINRDDKNERLTFVKQLAGVTRVRDTFGDEKVSGIRIYNGDDFCRVNELEPGQIGALLGLSATKSEAVSHVFVPTMSVAVKYPDTYSTAQMLDILKRIEEEEPTIAVSCQKTTGEISLSLMGEIGTDVLKDRIINRYGVAVEFSKCRTLYHETITAPIEGVGHYEPLRHYAEVHLLLSPAERGEGVKVIYSKPENSSDETAYRAVASHILEREHTGPLGGFPITDINIMILSLRTHEKHTVGGDLRNATYRAIRHGLMRSMYLGEVKLLEPYGRFSAVLPLGETGRLMNDIMSMGGTINTSESESVTGIAPMSGLFGYHSELLSYTKGQGNIEITFDGYYDAVSNPEENVYDPESDPENDAGSVFCSHGAGLYVPWYEVENYMHLPWAFHGGETGGETTDPDEELERAGQILLERAKRKSGEAEPVDSYHSGYILDKELKEVFERTYGEIKKKNIYEEEEISYGEYEKKEKKEEPYVYRPKKKKAKRLIVDGYNIIFGWDELKSISSTDINAARVRLCEILDNYSALTEGDIILVFDAYKVRDKSAKTEKFGNITVVYTGTDQTADAYIEAMVKREGKRMDITVASSDAMVQTMILGYGALRMPGRELKAAIETANASIKDYLK